MVDFYVGLGVGLAIIITLLQDAYDRCNKELTQRNEWCSHEWGG